MNRRMESHSMRERGPDPNFETVYQSTGGRYDYRRIDDAWMEFRFYDTSGNLVRHTALPRLPLISDEAVAELDRRAQDEELLWW